MNGTQSLASVNGTILRRTLFSLTVGLAALGLASTAQAAPFTGIPNYDNDGIPDLYDAWNRITGDTTTGNADLEAYRLAPDQDWTFTFNSVHVPVLGLTAGYSNTLGYYTPGDDSSAVMSSTPFTGFGFTGAGTLSDPFGSTTFAALPSGSIGFMLNSVTSNGTHDVFSEFHLNPGLVDHVVAYSVGDRLLSGLLADYGEIQMLNPILIGFEDILGGGDNDYDDTIFLVDATPVEVPLPATLWLVGGGLLVSTVMRRCHA